MATDLTDQRAAARDPASRWTPALIEKGFAPIASSFLAGYSHLTPPIRNSEAMLLIHLISFKWDDALPRPAFSTLAMRMGITATAVRNHVRSLEKKGYLARVARIGRPNQFDLRPLFSALEEWQKRATAEKAQKLRERES